MRRRSELKKVVSPTPLPARRSRRSRKVSENEKTEDETTLAQLKEETKEVPPAAAESAATPVEEINEEQQQRASSEERASPVRKRGGTRSTPKKRNQREKSLEQKVETIHEEAENGTETNNSNSDPQIKVEPTVEAPAVEESKATPTPPPTEVEETQSEPEKPAEQPEQLAKDKEEGKQLKEDQDQDVDEDATVAEKVEKVEKVEVEQSVEEVKVPSPSISLTASKEEEHLKTSSDVLDIQTEDVEEREEAAGPKEERREKKKHKEQTLKQDECPAKKDSNSNGSQSPSSHKSDEHKENRKEAKTQDQQKVEQPEEEQIVATIELASDKPKLQERSVRKRKWLTKKLNDRSAPVLAISTDSLKNIIADVVQPVPLSDVQLESSSEEEGLVTSEHDDDRSANDRSLTPELEAPKVAAKAEEEEQQAATTPTPAQISVSVSGKAAIAATVAPAPSSIARSPSPARNRASHVLYISNLVRPFTVLQLKGLLARTGKIVDEDGFWIDRIKSKCYVAYATEDEAIETRHALHGVRWPVSNPKCLNVDFGSRTDMDRAIQSTKDEAPKYAQDNTRDNQQSGNAWSRLDAGEKKPLRPVREWDVGKKEPSERDSKLSNDRRRGGASKERERAQDAERGGAADADRAGGVERKRSRERERGGRERGEHAHGRSRSASPTAKLKKKENEPPIRLLDDLFRKTKATPCIYWLPLTPEAIAEKEAFRQKRIEEHKQRIKERELERQKEREREKERDRQRDTRRNRSTERERRRTRSRERRRY